MNRLTWVQLQQALYDAWRQYDTPATKDQGRRMILATNPNLTGDGTALHVHSLLSPLGVKVTRLARGLPAGGQIEYSSKSVLSDAINERRQF